MSIKVIERMIYYCNELLAAFKIRNRKKISKWLNELEEENREELGIAKEFKINYLLSLHGMIAKKIAEIRKNINNPKKCMELIGIILNALGNIIDQREVRDKIIKETIHPILSSWGYRKKGRAFAKKEGGYFKKLNIHTHKTTTYYEVEFIFEITVQGPATSLENHRVEEKWFKLTEGIDIEKVKAEVAAHLVNDIKPFLDKFK